MGKHGSSKKTNGAIIVSDDKLFPMTKSLKEFFANPLGNGKLDLFVSSDEIYKALDELRIKENGSYLNNNMYHNKIFYPRTNYYMAGRRIISILYVYNSSSRYRVIGSWKEVPAKCSWTFEFDLSDIKDEEKREMWIEDFTYALSDFHFHNAKTNNGLCFTWKYLTDKSVLSFSIEGDPSGKAWSCPTSPCENMRNKHKHLELTVDGRQVLSVKNKSIINIDIPQGAIEFNISIFDKSKAKSLTIPASVKRINGICREHYMQNIAVHNAHLVALWMAGIIHENEDDSIYEIDKVHTNILTNICVNEDNKYFSSENGLLYNKDKQRLIKCPRCIERKSIIISNSCTVVDDWAFDNCMNVESVSLGADTHRIGNYSFYNCQSLKEININSELNSIGRHAFENCILLETISIPNSIKTINICSFRNCKSLKTVKLPNGITEIYKNAFENCTALESIEIPESINSIYESVFKRCENLKDVLIPNTVYRIDKHAFNGCECLENIEIPISVKYIGEMCFSGCSSLESINIPSAIEQINRGAFSNSGIKKINVAKKNPHYMSEDGVLYDKKKTNLIAYPTSKASKSISLPNKVVSISDYAFIGAKYLEIVKIGDSVKSIGERAFADCVTLSEIHLAVENPATIQFAENIFDNVSPDCKIFIPYGTGYAYRHHPAFQQFHEFITED